MKVVSAVALLTATLAGVLQGALSLTCSTSYDGAPVDRPEECQPWSPVCKSTGYCDKCDGSFGASGGSLHCTRQVPYCQTSNGRCTPCTSDAQCFSTVYPTCDNGGACIETSAPTPSPVPVASPVCEKSYDGAPVDSQECQPWKPVCKSTGYCDKCDSSFGATGGGSLLCTRQVPYCQTSNGRCKHCTSDAQCLSTVYPTCDNSGACTEYVPVATNAPTSSPYAVAKVLDDHNAYRCMHDAEDLTYSDSLEAHAKSHADILTNSANCGEFFHDEQLDTLGQGENLYSCNYTSTGTSTGEYPGCDSGSDATEWWYNEVEFYVEGPTGMSSDPDEPIGHFTQVVWKATTQLGCALATCVTPYTGADPTFQGEDTQVTTVVCRYTAPGNVDGKYLDNVDPEPTPCPAGN